MRDAIRAVVAVLGVMAILVGLSGVIFGPTTRMHRIASGVGTLLLVTVAMIPPGKPPPPVPEEW